MENLMIKKFDEIMNDVKTNGVASKWIKKINGVSFIDFDNVEFQCLLEIDVKDFFMHKSFCYDVERNTINIYYISYKEFETLVANNDDENNSNKIHKLSIESDIFTYHKFCGLIHLIME